MIGITIPIKSNIGIVIPRLDFMMLIQILDGFLLLYIEHKDNEMDRSSFGWKK